jgi:hypothetical protein
MYARVTQFEIDTVRISLDSALARFEDLVAPNLKKQPGYAGSVLMQTPEGKGVLVTFWDSAETAAASAGAFYDEQVAKFVTLMRQPPGREQYEVVYADDPAMLTVKGGTR